MRTGRSVFGSSGIIGPIIARQMHAYDFLDSLDLGWFDRGHDVNELCGLLGRLTRK